MISSEDPTPSQSAKGFAAEAIVQEVHSGRLTVFLPKYGVRAPVFLSTRDGASLVPRSFVPGTHCEGEFTVDDKETVVTVKTAIGSISISVFDHLTVLVAVEEARQAIHISLARVVSHTLLSHAHSHAKHAH